MPFHALRLHSATQLTTLSERNGGGSRHVAAVVATARNYPVQLGRSGPPPKGVYALKNEVIQSAARLK